MGRAPVKALVYHGPGQKSWDTAPDPSPAWPKATGCTHGFGLHDMLAAYDTFAEAGKHNALKVVISRVAPPTGWS